VPLFRLVALLLVEIAIGETISTALFRAGRRAATEPLTRHALTRIVADESRHRQLGWSAVAAVMPVVSEEGREALQREAASAFAAFEQQNVVPSLRWLSQRRPFDERWSELGVLSPETRVEAFYGAVERHVIPRLNRIGIDGARAYAERYRRATCPEGLLKAAVERDGGARQHRGFA
jgi:hypothetical protein